MGQSRGNFTKYPRTPHIFGSRGTSDDKYLGENDSLELIRSSGLVIEEKVDGANVGIHFDEDKLILQCRGHEVTSGMHPQFDPLKAWAESNRLALHSILGDRYLLFGEWLYARHHLRYTDLPHYLLEFDTWDKRNQSFLDTSSREKVFKGGPVISVAVIHTGPLNRFEDLIALLGTSAYGSDVMEGLYLKVESDGRVLSRAKYVRKSFTDEVEATGHHWSRRPVETNGLRSGMNLWQ